MEEVGVVIAGTNIEAVVTAGTITSTLKCIFKNEDLG